MSEQSGDSTHAEKVEILKTVGIPGHHADHIAKALQLHQIAVISQSVADMVAELVNGSKKTAIQAGDGGCWYCRDLRLKPSRN